MYGLFFGRRLHYHRKPLPHSESSPDYSSKKNLYLKVWVMPLGSPCLRCFRCFAHLQWLLSTSQRPEALETLCNREISMPSGSGLSACCPDKRHHHGYTHFHHSPPMLAFYGLTSALTFIFIFISIFIFTSPLCFAPLPYALNYKKKKTINLDFIQNAVHCQVPRHLPIPLPDPAGPEEPGLGKLLLMCELRLQW